MSMKYSATKKPLTCIMTESSCYKSGATMQVKGILLHSTGANNPNLKRYVQPSSNDPNRGELLALIGKNTNGNDWNRDVSAGLNAWIGKLADGTVAAVQVMPWNYKPWGCGSGSRGSCNNGWIQFEICEDGLTDKAYFDKVYQEAAELVAYLCQLYGLDPNGKTTLNGVSVPVILDHATSHALGLGSNHADVGHWFPKHGKSLDTFRADVAALLKTTTEPDPVTTTTGSAAGLEYPEGAIKHSEMFDLLKAAGMTDIGAAATMGNLYAESGAAANNLQNSGNTALNLSDEEFTAKLDSGAYSRETFVADKYGYGLAQWTYPTRKAALYDWMKEAGKGFGDAVTQINFLVHELQTSYSAVWAALTGGATTLREASDLFMVKFEVPTDQSEANKAKRAEYAQEMFDKYSSSAPAVEPSVPAQDGTTTHPTPYLVKVTTSALNVRKGPGTGYSVAMTIKDKGTYTIVEEAEGTGASVWGKLKSGAGWISLDYVNYVRQA